MKCHQCKHENPDDTLYCGKCGTQLSAPGEISAPTKTIEAAKEELTTGSTFADRYQIIEELGKGGMGKVYKVQDTKIKEKIALKLLKPDIASDKKTIERFSNELKFSRKIRHENVCQMYDLNEEEGTHYITMEYVHGEDLKRLIRKMGQMSAGQAISMAKQVCEGLIEAHKLGVVHRDLKPQNIMVDEEGKARIMDFGIARSLKGKGVTGAGVMIGTPEYMSPEQVEGKDTDQRSDIYSLGVILYEMVTGRVPFEGDTPFTIGVKQKSEIPKEPGELNSQVPSDLSGVIMKCLEKDKEKRYQSAGEVRTELIAIEKGIPTTERIIPERKPLTSREITVTFGLKKLFIPALVVIAIVIAGIIIWQVLPKKKVIPTAPSDKPSLAILYFENNSGDKNLDNWRSGLSEMLITDLSQSKYLHVLSGDRIYSLLEKLKLIENEKYSTDDLKKVAAQSRASHILRGSYITAGDKFIVSASLMKTDTAEVISSIREEGKGEASLTDSVDRITRRIKSDLNLTEEQISADLDRSLADITTKSPEAYKYYAEGNKLHLQSRYREAVPYFERAISIDPEFAIAYRFMAVAYSNLGNIPKRKEYLKKAMELKDRLSEKERYLIEGTYYLTYEDTYDKARTAFTKLLEIYPDHTVALSNLALTFYMLDQYEEAIPYFERAKSAKTEFAPTYNQLATCYRARGDYNQAKQVLEFYLENIGDSVAIRRGFAIHYRLLGEYDLALSEIEKAFAINPKDISILNVQAQVYLYKGDLENAENVCWKLMEFTEPGARYLSTSQFDNLDLILGRYERDKSRINSLIDFMRNTGVKWAESNAHRWLAYIHIQTGNFDEAVRECEQSWKYAVEAERPGLQRETLHLKGLAYIRQGSLAEAEQTAEELKRLIESGMDKKSIRLYYHLAGLIKLEKKNYAKAVDLIRKAISLVLYQSDALYIDSLASVYYKSGNLKKAQEQYEKIISLNDGRLGYNDIYAKSFYMLGMIYEQQGNKGKAIEHYERFLELWKNADPGLTEVEEAKKRLAALK
jgi:serine/threonine protein kinase/Tfp pilus assembly protein PilF